jgi:hypothetical protein
MCYRQNNPITPFSTSVDIINFLRTQWAGLFKASCKTEGRFAEFEVLNEMSSIANTLKELVNFLTDERSNKDEAIKTILLTNHPAFRAFASVTDTKYRVFFTTRGDSKLG